MGGLKVSKDRSECFVKTTPRRLYTAGEFLATFEPATLDAFVDRTRALHDDTLRAAAIADDLRIAHDGYRFAASVWGIVYP
jgi:hypothetical protein